MGSAKLLGNHSKAQHLDPPLWLNSAQLGGRVSNRGAVLGAGSLLSMFLFSSSAEGAPFRSGIKLFNHQKCFGAG